MDVDNEVKKIGLLYKISGYLITLLSGAALSILVDRFILEESNGVESLDAMAFYTFLFSMIIVSIIYIFHKAHDKSYKLQEHNKRSVEELVNRNLSAIDDLIDAKVQLLSSDLAYETMAKEVRSAKHKISLLSRIRHNGFCTVNNEGGEVSVYRKQYYDALTEAATDGDVIFNRVILVDRELFSGWHQVVADFRVIGQEIVNLFSSHKNVTNKSKVYVAKASLEMNMVLIDDSKLFFNVFTETPTKTYLTDLMFYVESSEHGLHELCNKFEEIKTQASIINFQDAKLVEECLNAVPASVNAGM